MTTPVPSDEAALTWHGQWARCADCGHATVGTSKPYAINHTARCSVPDRTRRHSTACVDYRYDGGIECVCQPSADAPPPDTYELWWCTYCGESSCEDSDPCQRCGEAIVRRTYASDALRLQAEAAAEARAATLREVRALGQAKSEMAKLYADQFADFLDAAHFNPEANEPQREEQ